jgi:hypothetical protein
MRISFIVLIILILSACSTSSPEQKTVVDWTNFLEWNNHQYIGNEQVFVSNPSDIGKSVGRTSFHVQKHVHDSSYKPKNGDAAFLPEGTTLHAVKEVSPKQVLAVSTQRVYTTKNFKEPSLFQEKITKIQLKKEGKTIFSATDPSTISTLRSIVKEGTLEEMPSTASTPVPYTIYFYLSSPLSLKYSLFEVDGMFYLEKDKGIRLPEEFVFYVK